MSLGALALAGSQLGPRRFGRACAWTRHWDGPWPYSTAHGDADRRGINQPVRGMARNTQSAHGTPLRKALLALAFGLGQRTGVTRAQSNPLLPFGGRGGGGTGAPAPAPAPAPTSVVPVPYWATASLGTSTYAREIANHRRGRQHHHPRVPRLKMPAWHGGPGASTTRDKCECPHRRAGASRRLTSAWAVCLLHRTSKVTIDRAPQQGRRSNS